MTGEITLRGRVMPIGGLKEKLLAAHRSGITTVIIPKENRKDLREVPRRVLKATRIVLVEHMDDVLREALCLPDPNALFGPAPRDVEYRDGELVVRSGAHAAGGRAARSGGGVREPGASPAAPAEPAPRLRRMSRAFSLDRAALVRRVRASGLGRVAQWQSAGLTSRMSQVQSLSRLRR